MTVAQLKKLLEDVQDDYDVAIVVNFFDRAIEDVSVDDDSKIVYLFICLSTR